jgi:predicted dehydrogenase/threonine dehydrogenase-like Zn-dependent dehydrogenase
MSQLTQQLKSGKMEIVEVPLQEPLPGQVLVRNYYSVISSGTEGKTVSDARKGYVAKARSRKKEVQQVIELIRSQGISAAYKMVMNKLDALSPLGYSCAGEVLAVAKGITDIKVGDLVACGGSEASHADFVTVPKNLCAVLDPAVDLREASFITIASIALQGVRQSEVQLGGKCIVIGLGLIGILTLKILKAAGIRSVGIDIDQAAVNRATEVYGFAALQRNLPELTGQVRTWTNNIGADAVIITAGSNSNDPVNLAGELCKQKGKVVVVGAVPTGFDRNHYYRKELDLRMSCSYGPGRYDKQYEEKGNDYPAGYVRWTERRNMQSIAEMLADNTLCFSDLISHTFSLEQAPEAYDMILQKNEPFLGILIRYDKQIESKDFIRLKIATRVPAVPRIGIIGAGSFAQNIVLPLLKKKTALYGIATTKGVNAIFAGRTYGFELATASAQLLIKDKTVDTVFILTRHHLHAQQTIDALKEGKNVFVEKPPAISQEELDEIAKTYSSLSSPLPVLMTGFNRRFAPAVKEISGILNTGLPKAITIRVNAGMLPSDHWVNDPETGGGRIVGEACHFIDLSIFLAGSNVKSVYATSLNSADQPDNTVNVSLKFENGSIANISYFSNGNKKVPKELIEVFCGQSVARIDDFRLVEIYRAGRNKKIRYRKTDKGHEAEIDAFLSAVNNSLASPIAFEEIYHSMQVTLSVNTSLQENRVITF